MKKETIIKVLYGLAALGFFTYLVTKQSGYMFCGGLLMIVASVMLILKKK